MSCERTWWEYVASVNAHIGALHEFLDLSGMMFGAMTPRDSLLLSYEEVNELLDAIGHVDATMREQRRQLELYYAAMREHGGYSPGVENSF